MSGTPVRGGATGKSVAPKKTLHKDAKTPQLWKDFMNSVKRFREDAGLSVQEVADALGVSVAKIYIWENGKSTPHPHDLCVYLALLGVKHIKPE